MKRNTDIKIKVIECNSKTNTVILQTSSQTFVLNSQDFVNFIQSASPVKVKKETIETIENEIVRDVIEYLNTKSGRDFQYNEKNATFISARLADGHSPDLLKKVIDIKCYEWKENLTYRRYLRPETLFNPTKFESYRQEVLDIIKDPEAFKNHVKAKNNERVKAEYDNLAELATRRPKKQ
ncbi:conserved phage C-terminal domain-containing protein [uncultured Chryseobacterium sp.]|uniref:conserved phage C-terminal domain-containing protein n=1 Tax=uncultured Chryseobacterium sp. TaxID=259322 RepID=UPI0025FF7B2D|nr:conserved phage C-terminal domain-containing protein [uncultured Chryseobacterium sp.]